MDNEIMETLLFLYIEYLDYNEIGVLANISKCLEREIIKYFEYLIVDISCGNRLLDILYNHIYIYNKLREIKIAEEIVTKYGYFNVYTDIILSENNMEYVLIQNGRIIKRFDKIDTEFQNGILIRKIIDIYSEESELCYTEIKEYNGPLLIRYNEIKYDINGYCICINDKWRIECPITDFSNDTLLPIIEYIDDENKMNLYGKTPYNAAFSRYCNKDEYYYEYDEEYEKYEDY